MMSKCIAAILAFSFLVSCSESEHKTQNVVNAAGQIIDGISINYYDDGSIRSEVPVKDGKRHGEAREYYENGQLAASIAYENDLKNGTSKWYYQDGILYQQAIFVDNKKHGLEKKYYNTGELMAVLRWKEGETLPGLMEFHKNGKEVRQPSIVVTEKGGKLTIRLSNGAERVVFYAGQLADDQVLDPTMHRELETKKGLASMPATGAPVHLIAVRRSNMKHPQILRYTYQP